jgi:hypothetical protein
MLCTAAAYSTALAAAVIFGIAAISAASQSMSRYASQGWK